MNKAWKCDFLVLPSVHHQIEKIVWPTDLPKIFQKIFHILQELFTFPSGPENVIPIPSFAGPRGLGHYGIPQESYTGLEGKVW